MRAAVALSGLPRISAISAASWGRLIGNLRADVYVHTWNEGHDISAAAHLINWVFKPVGLQIDPLPDIDTAPYPDRHWPCIDVYRSLSMWHGISRAHGMVRSSGRHYDLVIRGRMDWHVHWIDVLRFDGVVIPYDSDKIPLRFRYGGVDMHGLNDHFAYGPPECMDAYARTLDEIPLLYANEGVDYCPENFLAASLAKQGVPVMLQQMEHTLVR